MGLPKFEYFKVKTLHEGLELLSQYKDKARVFAGGTALLTSMKQGLIAPQVIVSIGSLLELNFIDCRDNADMRIGSVTSIHSIKISKPIMERYPILAQSARQIGSIQLSHMGTLGGNLCLDTRCWYYNQPLYLRKARPFCLKMGGDVCNVLKKGDKCFAIYSGDMAPALIALGAQIKLLSIRGERIIPLRDFYTGNGTMPNVMVSDELLTEVRVPFSFSKSGAYLKYRLRNGIDFPLASVAVVLRVEDGICKEVKMVLGAVDSRPVEVEGVGRIFEGKKIDDDLIEIASQEANRKARPVSNAASTPETRRNMVKLLARRAIKKGLKSYLSSA